MVRSHADEEEHSMDYTKICFVIMPFGKKELIDENGRRRTVDFDSIYQSIFRPAIRDARLPEPETGALESRRTDKDFFSGDISQEMFDYLEYSRMALTDITSLNPNVFYELGVRHRARQSGTTIFRQIAAKIPFDIIQIKAFPYDYEPELQARESIALITRILTESLAQNRIDSPVQRALAVKQTQRPQIQVDLRAAENALRVGDRPRAISAYRQALVGDPGNNLLFVRLGLLLKDDGRWQDALEQFDMAIATAPTYGEAYREKGIAENKLYQKVGKPTGMPNGVDALMKAVELNPDDYDAHASLAGALKRDGRLADALAEYERATDVSRGHSYPLLNALKLKAQLEGKLVIDDKRRFLLKRAERSLRAQVSSDPPHDPPWSFFDLSEIRLYDGDKKGFLSYASRGVEYATHAWQLNTFRESLELLPAAGIDLPGLGEGIALLREQASYLL
jgi:tetratricopeptide (TPR) repeat protein